MRRIRNLLLLSAACTEIAAIRAQSPDTTDWQTAAGGKIAFEVASVKPTKIWRRPLFPLDAGNAVAPGGRFSATFSLAAYIVFAYKLSLTDAQLRAMLAPLPAWVGTETFSIDARADGNPTKDQMRLMMQALLAERFKLAVHFEAQEVPVFALTLVRPGKIGPKLRPYAEGPPCPDSYTMPARGALNSDDLLAASCGAATMSGKNGLRLIGSRNAPVSLLANAIASYGAMDGEIDKPVVDRTGLHGRFDFTIEYRPGENDAFTRGRPGPLDPDAPPPDPSGAPFLNAVREQLGLKLVSSKSPPQILIIDHVERPSEN